MMNPAQTCAIVSIRLYQVAISPLLVSLFGPGSGCRYAPTCSAYACDAIRNAGVFRGGALALRRLCRCHPWGGCGCDPVPQTKSLSGSKAISPTTR